jgi:hypothetical protein
MDLLCHMKTQFVTVVRTLRNELVVAWSSNQRVCGPHCTFTGLGHHALGPIERRPALQLYKSSGAANHDLVACIVRIVLCLLLIGLCLGPARFCKAEILRQPCTRTPDYQRKAGDMYGQYEAIAAMANGSVQGNFGVVRTDTQRSGIDLQLLPCLRAPIPTEALINHSARTSRGKFNN